MNAQTDNFYYLNADNRWPGIHLHGMEIAGDGALQLRALPRLVGALSPGTAGLERPDGQAGIAGLPDGRIFLSDLEGNRIWNILPCDDSGTPMATPCLGGKGSLPTRFRGPRGLLAIPGRGLFVADSGNHRVQIFALDTLQLTGILGSTDGAGAPAPGLFDQPTALAADNDGNVYVLSLAGKRVQKFDRLDRLDDSFWQNVEAHQALEEPEAIAVAVIRGETRVFILDRARQKIFSFTPDGREFVYFAIAEAPDPAGLAVTEDAIYIGDNQLRSILQFDQDGTFVGRAVGYQGPVAALALDGEDQLLVHPGDVSKWTRLAISAGHLRGGFFWIGPIDRYDQPLDWHRIKALVEGLDDDSHARFSFFTSDWRNAVSDSDDAQAFFANWRQLPRDVNDGFIGGERTKYLWVGGLLSGDGTGTARIPQIRVEFNHQTYLRFLPELYTDDDASREFLIQFLSLFESFFGESESNIDRLPSLFDPAVTPAEFLPWLASWLAVHIRGEWPEAKKRQVIAEAFQNYAWRGTAKGLRKNLETYAGVKAQIFEPVLYLDLWTLGETSTLGVDTMLASAHPQGAVVGTTATLDRSHLISDDQAGAPIFEEVAHQFAVYVYRGEIRTAEKEEEVRRLIERDKPAHTGYQLCIIEPRMRVGFQSRVGIDTVIAGPPTVLRLNQGLGKQNSLSGIPPGRIGQRSRIGVTTRIY